MFQNPVYIGEAYSGVTRNTHAHPPLVRPAIWLAPHAASSAAGANARGTTLLAGLVRCQGCCHPVGHMGWASGGHVYRCLRRYSQGSCTAPVCAPGAALEQAVVDAFLCQLDRHRPSRDLEPVLAAAEARLLAIEEHVYSHPRWRSAYTDIESAGVSDGRAQVLSLWRQMQLATLPAARELARRWPSLTRSEQRQILGTGLECVIVSEGSAPPSKRIELLFAGARRDWYPKKGERRRPQPFTSALAAPPLDTVAAGAGGAGVSRRGRRAGVAATRR